MSALFSTEMVSKYHPDKVADQISDAILTECLKQDKNSHVACETLVKGKDIVIAGEITTSANSDFNKIAKQTCQSLGYEVDNVTNLITKQSPEINNAVLQDSNIGAGDQGMMFGYAISGGKYYLPLGFEKAIDIIKAVENDVVSNPNSIIKGDAKTQVTTDLETGKFDTVLLSVCHKEGYDIEFVRKYLKNILESCNIDSKNTKILVNPSGIWTFGGPSADCGLTGRKIVCDQYGGYCAVGGGAFSGKDPSKVDRSASYMARKIAVNLVREYELYDCTVQLAYAIGRAHPVSVSAKAHYKNDNVVDFSDKVLKEYDLTPKGIINTLNLLETDYTKIACGNHMIHFI